MIFIAGLGEKIRKEKKEERRMLFSCLKFEKLEDRFSCLWAYFLNQNPQIAQLVVDYIAGSSNRVKPSNFKNAIFAPKFNNADKPDLLLECKDYSIICEHKIESLQGLDQISRYLRLKNKNTPLSVAFISNRTDEIIKEEILNDSRFLRPVSSLCNYYLWENFYSIIDGNQGYVLDELLCLMRSLGMNPFRVPGWGNIFMEYEGRQAFKKALELARNLLKGYFDGSGQFDPNSLGLQIRKPTKLKTQVLHLFAEKGRMQIDRDISGPLFLLHIKSSTSKDDQLQELTQINENTEFSAGTIYVRTPKTRIIDGKHILLREYGMRLEQILVDKNFEQSRVNIEIFIKKCIKHLKETDTSLFC